MKFTFTPASKNVKTGPIPTVIVSRDTCPPSCELYNGGCYALGGNVRIHWNRTNVKGMSFQELLGKVNSIADNAVWRYGVAGDLPGYQETIDRDALDQLVKANVGKRGYAYSHKNPLISNNAEAIKSANKGGFTINLSANNTSQADTYLALDIAPVVTIIPHDADPNWRNTKTPAGNMIVRCPAEYSEHITCSNCGGSKGALCSRSDRNFVVGFTTHGAAKRKASEVAKKHLNIIQ